MTAEHIRVDFFKKLAGDEDYQRDEMRWLCVGDDVNLSAETYVKISVACDGGVGAITIDGRVVRPNAFGEIVIDCAVRAVLSVAGKEIKPVGRIRRILDV